MDATTAIYETPDAIRRVVTRQTREQIAAITWMSPADRACLERVMVEILPRWHAVLHAERLRKFAAEGNAELRRVALEIYGFDRYAEARGARVVDEDISHGRPRRLLEMVVRGEAVRVIDVHNGSLEPDGSRRRFHLGAMRGDTVRDAVAASYGIVPRVYREAVRT